MKLLFDGLKRTLKGCGRQTWQSKRCQPTGESVIVGPGISDGNYGNKCDAVGFPQQEAELDHEEAQGKCPFAAKV